MDFKFFFKKTSAHAFNHTFQRLQLFKKLGFSPKKICDIGASDGRWSKDCYRIFPEASYFCVDPLDVHIKKLDSLSLDNPHFKYWNSCLGAEPSTAIMNVDGAGSSLLKGHSGNTYGTQKTVNVDTLDNLITKKIFEQPDLIKMDVQGYELEVLKGATRTIPQVQMIITEVSFYPFQERMPIFHEVVQYLSSHDFLIQDILSLSTRPLDDLAGQCDLLFLKKDHPLRQNNKWDVKSTY